MDPIAATPNPRRLLPEEDAIIGPDDDEADPDDSLPADLWF